MTVTLDVPEQGTLTLTEGQSIGVCVDHASLISGIFMGYDGRYIKLGQAVAKHIYANSSKYGSYKGPVKRIPLRDIGYINIH